MQSKAACFTGHRPDGLPAAGVETAPGMTELIFALKNAVEDAANEGVTVFYAGGAAGFDTLAAEAVLDLKAKRPGIELRLALPTREPHRLWSERQKRRFDEILARADAVHAETDGPATPAALMERNRYMVDHADLVIAYLTKNRGGTRYTVSYAKKKGVPVRNLANTVELTLF